MLTTSLRLFDAFTLKKIMADYAIGLYLYWLDKVRQRENLLTLLD